MFDWLGEIRDVIKAEWDLATAKPKKGSSSSKAAAKAATKKPFTTADTPTSI